MKPFERVAGILGSEKGSSRQQLLLLVLLLLVGAFAYLYFFTGLIVPREQAPKAPPVAAAPEKKPLPPRPEQTTAQAPVKTEAAPAATTAKAEPPKQTPPPAKPEPAKPAAAPAKPETAKQPAPAPPVPAAKPAAPGKPVAPAKPEPAKPATVAKTEPAKVPAAKPEAKKPGAAPKAVVKQGAKTAHGAYALQIGDVAADEVSKVKSLLKKLGITPVAQKHVKEVKQMHRLFVADFAEHSGADAELQRVRKVSSDAFILPVGEKFAVYAGSYLSDKRALSERNRLSAQGIKISVQKTKVSVPLVRISAGNFSDSASADAAGKRLRKHGLSARVVKKG
ncbi:MAG TPA: SPOR domain-containing protein [Geobacteraceae bacterium]